MVSPESSPDTSTFPAKESKPASILIRPSFAVIFPEILIGVVPASRVMVPFFCEAVVAIRLPGIKTALFNAVLADPISMSIV